mmetsp:Transcript_30350/g.47104  ORF Transcript_30350/g.47104 Transcript_30350/m.47104 type:complete len:234 (-) Transcript_30350:140-841(-)
MYSSSTSNPPFSSSLSVFLQSSPFLCCFLSSFILLMEIIIIPISGLFLPPRWRWCCSVLMLCMHLGIFVVMSKKVALAFFTTLPLYFFSFCVCHVEVGGVCWSLGVVVVMCVVVRSVCFDGLIEEVWPFSNCALFMWNGQQAKILGDLFMGVDNHKTKIIMCTEERANNGVVGCNVLSHGFLDSKKFCFSSSLSPPSSSLSVSPSPPPFVHDALLRLFSFTFVREGDEGGKGW